MISRTQDACAIVCEKRGAGKEQAGHHFSCFRVQTLSHDGTQRTQEAVKNNVLALIGLLNLTEEAGCLSLC
jgi:hypothetical protein